jgi:drug/metabolite transporter (DMT)-like permease
MVYLLLAILCGALFSIVFKLGQRFGADGLQVIFFNYLVAFLFTLLPILAHIVLDPSVSSGDYVPGPSSWLLAVVQGAFFVTGFTVMDRSTRRSGVALTTVCARASLVLPVLLSWMLLGQPAPAWLPILLTVAALAFIVGPSGPPVRSASSTDIVPSADTAPFADAPKLTASSTSGNSSASHLGPASGSPSAGLSSVLALLGVFLVFGLSDFFLKVVQHTVEKGTAAEPALMESRLSGLTCIIFLMATLAALGVCLLSGSFRKNKVTWATAGWGALLGIANIGCTSCMLRALGVMPTGLYYPLYNIGIVLVATLAGLIFFGERLSWRQAAGLALALSAIAFSF